MTDQQKPHFDGTINLGHVLLLFGVVVSSVGQWYLMDYRLSHVERQIERLGAVVTEYARVDERLKAQERRLDALERVR